MTPARTRRPDRVFAIGRVAILVLLAAVVHGAAPAHAASCADGLPAPKRRLTAATWDDLAAHVRAAEPGDHILLARGTYAPTAPLRLDRSGTAADPILVAAESVSAAEIAGQGGFHIADAAHLVVCGFTFTHAPWDTSRLPLAIRGVPGADDEIVHAVGTLIETSHHTRLTRNVFKLHDETPNAFWLVISGAGGDHRVDHNRFEGKKSRNSFLAVYGPADGMSERDVVDHNHFFKHGYNLEGGEAVRHGNGGRATWSSHAVYEYNLFEKCNGDPEALSVKTSDTTIRFNTVTKSHGGIVLRHGDRNRVEGNFIVDNEGGIRIYGDDHRIVDNYVSGNVGVGGLGSMVLLSGGTEDDTGSGQSQNRPTGVLIENNTIVDNPFSHLDVGGSLPLPPRRCRILNNIIQGQSGKLFQILREPEESTWNGNILWGRAGSGDTSSGYQRRDPKLVKDAHGIFRPPAGETAGARQPGGTLGRPLTGADVGPDAP
jgi:poly(beta-D-mannuronate) lyase